MQKIVSEVFLESTPDLREQIPSISTDPIANVHYGSLENSLFGHDLSIQSAQVLELIHCLLSPGKETYKPSRSRNAGIDQNLAFLEVSSIWFTDAP